MNIRKNIDYSEMYAALDNAMAAERQQMKLYCEIGKAVCKRTENGAAVAAAEYLSKQYPDVQGFSPRNLRRMRDFYRTYENHPRLLDMALQIGWIQNVVIMEADLSAELREWYIKAAKQFGWSKTTLIERIAGNAHEEIVLAIEEDLCYSVAQEQKHVCCNKDLMNSVIYKIRNSVRKLRFRWQAEERGIRRWPIMLYQTSTEKRIAFIRCWKRSNSLGMIHCISLAT